MGSIEDVMSILSIWISLGGEFIYMYINQE